MSFNPSRAARKRGAYTEADSTTTTTFRPGQAVAVEAAAFGDFDEVAQGTVQKADEFGRVVSRYECGKSCSTERPGTNPSLIPTTLGVL